MNQNGWRMRDNILSVWYGSSEAERREGGAWYEEANATAWGMAERYEMTLDTVANVISILSPSCRWERNVRDAERLISAHSAGLPVASVSVSTYGQNRAKAWHLLRGTLDDPVFSRRAKKTGAFAALIIDPWADAVVVDGHAICIALGERVPLDQVPRIGIRAYDTIASAYRSASDLLGARPSTVQATTWLAWRNTHLSTASATYGWGESA